MNSSTNITSCPNAVSIFFTTTMAIISLAAFIGNILVVIAVYKTPNLRTSTNFYYVNMAVSDFLSCLTTWPLYLTDEIITSSGSVLQGSLATFGCKVGVFFRMVSSIVSILSLVLIAVDRFIATVFPLKATLITRKFRAALLFGTWLISIGYCIPMFYYFRVVNVGQETFCQFVWNDLALMIYYITGLALFEVIPLITIIVLYSRIMRALRQRLNPEFNARRSNVEQNRYKQNQNIMKIFKSIVVMLFVWFSLFCVYLILKITFPELFVKDRCKWILGFAHYVVPLLSTATNPVILFSFSTNFRQALSELCAFSFCKFRPCCKTQNTSPRQGEETLPELETLKNMMS
ncbi:melanopsin-like [Oculina patagonica]